MTADSHSGVVNGGLPGPGSMGGDPEGGGWLEVPLDLGPAEAWLPRSSFPMLDLRRRVEEFPPYSGANEYREGRAFLERQYEKPVALKPDPLYHARDATLFRGMLWVGGQLVPGTLPKKHLAEAEQWPPLFPRWQATGRMTTLPGTTALINAPGFRNYFHWMVEALPRLRVLQRYLDLGIGPIDRILITQKAPHDFVLDSISTFFPRLLPLVALGLAPRHRLEQALFFVDWRYVAYTQTRMKPNTALFLRDIAPPPVIGPERGPGRAVLISRGDADNRRLVNEDALLRAFAPLGLESVALAGLSIREQQKAMSEARLVVGVHGAGLTNLMFCPPGATLLEITSSQYIKRCRSYADLAALRGFRYGLAVVDQIGESWVVTKNRGNDLEIAPDALEPLRAFAERLLAGEAEPPAAAVTDTPSPGDPMDEERPAPAEADDTIATRINELIRLQKLALLGPDRVLQFTQADCWVRFHLPLVETDQAQRRIFAQRDFLGARQLAEIRPLIGPDSVVIDAGAHIGNSTVHFALIGGARRVHAFEPMRVAFSILQRNMELNGLSNVAAYNLALGAAEGEATVLRADPRHTGGATLRLDAPAGGGGYRVVPIDSLQLDRCDLIKLDVEGAHIPVLEGAVATLARCRPLVWLALPQRRQAFGEAEAWFGRHGYRLIRGIAGSAEDFLFGPA